MSARALFAGADGRPRALWRVVLFLLLSLACGIAVVAARSSAEGQQAITVPRLGVLIPGAPPLERVPHWEGFRQGLRDLRYVEGQTILLEYRWAEGKPERYPDLVADLLRLPVDVLV